MQIIQTQDDTSPFRFVYEGIEAGTGPSGTVMGAEEAERVARAFTQPLTYAAVHQVGLYDDAGLCAVCEVVYCSDHWNVSTTGGSRCPQGHFKSMDPRWHPDPVARDELDVHTREVFPHSVDDSRDLQRS